MNANFFIWRDPFDPDWFILGVKSGTDKNRYYAISSIHVDGLDDMLGNKIRQELVDSNYSLPIKVEGNVWIKHQGKD